MIVIMMILNVTKVMKIESFVIEFVNCISYIS